MKTKTVIATLASLTALTMSPLANAQCMDADFVDADTQSSIAFQGRSYTPRCLRVLAGSEVTIAASRRHPLAPQIGNDKNPIRFTESTETYVFDEPGRYGYFCTDHGTQDGRGMAGEIIVVEE
jgi:plastocyanin